MIWGLRKWLLALAGASALAALVTLIGVFLVIIVLQERYLQERLDPELWQRYHAAVPLSTEETALIERELGLYDSEWVLLAAFLPSFMVAVCIGWLGSAPLLRHLAALRRTAQRVRAADLSARVPAVRPTAREIASFARDFDALIARAERAERESRASAAALAHELRTPLTVIRGRLQGMMDGVFATSTAELGLLMGQVDVLHRLIEDMRFLTLFEAGRMSFRSERLRMDDLVRDSLSIHPGVAVVLDAVEVYGDRARLSQAVTALLENANRHAGGADHITLARVGAEAVLAVMDRGPGLTEAEVRHAFDRFWRKDSANPEGSGLGLSVTRAIAVGHNGRIEAHPRAGGGMVFQLRLPVASEGRHALRG